jgi:hypothetical protein
MYKFSPGELVACYEYYSDMIVKSSATGVILDRCVIFHEGIQDYRSLIYSILMPTSEIKNFEEWQLEKMEID